MSAHLRSRLCLFRKREKVVGSATPEYPFQTPKPLWAETDPEVWWEATCKAMRSLLGEVKGSEIASVGLTGQMHGMVALDAKGGVLRPCIMWNDQRSYRECDEITQMAGEREILRITGNPVLAGFTAPKVLWVKNNEPDVFSSIARSFFPRTTFVTSSSGNSLPAFRMHPVPPFWMSAIENGPRKCLMHWDGPPNGCPR